MRKAADRAIEHLVQQHGLNRADIFVEGQRRRNHGKHPFIRRGRTQGRYPIRTGLAGALKVSVDGARKNADLVRATFEDMGGRDISTH
jgi:hypothetical protein